MKRARTGGFTLIEVMITTMIVAILVNLAIPAIRGLTLRAQGAAVIGDVAAIETAAFDYYARNGGFPPTAFGSIPAGLEASLPSGFSFNDGTTVYGWVTIDVPGTRIIGTIVQNPFPEIMTRVAQSHSGPYMGSQAGPLMILLIE